MTTALKKCKKCTVVSRQLQVQKLVGWFARCCVGLVCRGESDGGLSELTYGLCYSSEGSSSSSSSEGQGNAAREAVKIARWARCTAIPIRTRPRNGFFMAKGRGSECRSRSRSRFRSLPWQR